MKPIRCGVVLFTLLTSVMLAQTSFEVPLRFTDGVMTDTVYFGIVTNANFCIVETDCFNNRCEFFLPPRPPCQCFDIRFVSPRGGWNLSCFDQGSFYDYRPLIHTAQRDTFRVYAQRGEGSAPVLSWPSDLGSYFLQLTLRYFDENSQQLVYVDMLADTLVEGDFAYVTIFSVLWSPFGLNPLSLAFGDVPVGNNATLPVTVRNNWTSDTLIITTIRSPLGFIVTPNPPGQFPLYLAP